MWRTQQARLVRCSAPMFRHIRATTAHSLLPCGAPLLSARAFDLPTSNLTLWRRQSMASMACFLTYRHLSTVSRSSVHQRCVLQPPSRSFASQRNKQRSASHPASTPHTAPSPPSAPLHAYGSPPPPSSSYSPNPYSSPADGGRLIFATTLTFYARGVPYIFLLVLLPVVSYSIYATYAPSTAASAAPSPASPLSILPLTVVPLSFLLVVAAFVRFNRRLVATIHLLPDRRLALTTLNMLPSSSPACVVKPLDSLLPPYAWLGSTDRTLSRLRFVREGERGGVDEYWLYAVPSKAGQQGAELLRRIMTDNRLSNREIAM